MKLTWGAAKQGADDDDTARPLNCKFTAADLTGVLDRFGARQEPVRPVSLPDAA